MPSVLILLATCNGEEHLEEQIASFSGQSINNIHILASDDGSTDGTLRILQEAKRSWDKGDFSISRGPQKGVEENFRSLILQAGVEADYYAFSDQDDVWHSDKLERAISFVSSAKCRLPAAYGSRTRTIDASGNLTGFSPLFAKPAIFQNALVQSIAGGNTMLLNKAAFLLMKKAVELTDFVSHDWFTYQMVTGAGGEFHYDEMPSLLYRQHGRNLIGANNSMKDKLVRLKKSFAGQMKIWSERNIIALEKCSHLLGHEAIEVLNQFKIAHNDRSLVRRLIFLRRCGVYRQTVFGQVSLYGACILRLL